MRFTRRSRVLRRGPGRKQAWQASQLRRPEELETRVAPSETLSSLLASAWLSTPADVPAQVAENLPVDGSSMASGKLSRQSRWRAESSARFVENFAAGRGVADSAAERVEAEPVRWSPILPFVSQPRPRGLDVSSDLRVWDGPADSDAGAVGLASGANNSAAGGRVWGPAPTGGGSTRAQLGPVPNTAVWIPAAGPQVAPAPAPRSSGEEMARASGGGDAPHTDSPVAPPPTAPSALSAKKANFVNPAGVDWADVALNLQTDVTAGKVKLPPGKARTANDGSSATPFVNEALTTEPALGTDESTSEPDIVLPAEVDAAFNSLTNYLIGNAGRGMDTLQRELFKSYGRELKGDKADQPDKGNNGRGIGGRSLTPTSRATTAATGTGTGSCGGSTSTGNTLPIVIDDGPYFVAIDSTLTAPVLRSGIHASVLQNDRDCETTKLSAHLMKKPSNGTLVFKSDGTFKYTPFVNHSGPDMFWYVAHDGVAISAVAKVVVYTIGADLDADTDNNYGLERSPAEEMHEKWAPGKTFIHGEREPNGSLRTPMAISLVGAESLGALDLQGWNLQLTPPSNAGQSIDYFAKDTGVDKPTSLSYSAVDTIQRQQQGNVVNLFVQPKTDYVGSNEYRLELRPPTQLGFHVDNVQFTAVKTPVVTAYRPQVSGGATTHYHSPNYDMFRRREIPRTELLNTDIAIRRNGDIDSSTDEDDYIEMQAKNIADLPGVEYRLERSDEYLTVHDFPLPGPDQDDLFAWQLGMIVGDHFHSRPLKPDVNGTVEMWAEWKKNNISFPQSGEPLTAGLSLGVYANGRLLKKFDSVNFKPINSAVVVVVGEFQIPSDPPAKAGQGTIGMAIKLYELGYDVYMYDEPDTLDRTPTPYNVMLDEIRKGINSRGVQELAMIGYSHGGGTVDLAATQLKSDTSRSVITQPWSLVLTSYIDAVHISSHYPEEDRPVDSLFHAGFYQYNTWNLHGAPSNGDVDLDMTYTGSTHTTIDDHPTVIQNIINYVKTKVSR